MRGQERWAEERNTEQNRGRMDEQPSAERERRAAGAEKQKERGRVKEKECLLSIDKDPMEREPLPSRSSAPEGDRSSNNY